MLGDLLAYSLPLGLINFRDLDRLTEKILPLIRLRKTYNTRKHVLQYAKNNCMKLNCHIRLIIPSTVIPKPQNDIDISF